MLRKILIVLIFSQAEFLTSNAQDFMVNGVKFGCACKNDKNEIWEKRSIREDWLTVLKISSPNAPPRVIDKARRIILHKAPKTN